MNRNWTTEDVYMITSRAYDYATQGRYQEAIILFEGVLAVAPDNAYARRALAAVFLQNGNALGALGALDETPGNVPSPVERKLRLEAYLALEWYSEAHEEFAHLDGRIGYAERNRYASLLKNRSHEGTQLQ